MRQRRSQGQPASVGLLDAYESAKPILMGLLGVPTEEEGAQMGLLDAAFLDAHAAGDRRGMAEAIGQRAALVAPYFAGAGVIKAYHGSPHSFDKFKMDRIGTGEGAQAYGHGLYFAESEDVARSYRDGLSPSRAAENQRQMQIGELRQSIKYDENDLASIDEGNPQGFLSIDAKSMRQDITRNKARLKELEELEIPLDGSIYEVNINANPDDFLDWDKPLSEQPESVRRAFLNTNTGDDPILRELLDTSPEGMMMQGMVPGSKGSAAYRTLVERGNADGAIGEHLGPNNPPMKTGDKWATEALMSEGIPGIKYFDGNSRDNGQGTRNYVVFDENLISIVKKYGIAGAVSAGLLTSEQAQAFMDQQNDQGAVKP